MKRIELKFSLKIARSRCFENKLHSQIRAVVAVQYVKIDHELAILTIIPLFLLFKSQKCFSGGFLGR